MVNKKKLMGWFNKHFRPARAFDDMILEANTREAMIMTLEAVRYVLRNYENHPLQDYTEQIMRHAKLRGANEQNLWAVQRFLSGLVVKITPENLHPRHDGPFLFADLYRVLGVMWTGAEETRRLELLGGILHWAEYYIDLSYRKESTACL